jgi:hypothetical protein
MGLIILLNIKEFMETIILICLIILLIVLWIDYDNKNH